MVGRNLEYNIYGQISEIAKGTEIKRKSLPSLDTIVSVLPDLLTI
jgi:hypothetical protein